VSQQCVMISSCCDGFSDCSDFSDELVCNRKQDQGKCRLGDFMCVDRTRCLSMSSLCDGIKQCPDGSDEIPAVCQRVKSH
jgi:hypothetical protein